MSDLISRQALCEYALNQKDKAVTPNDIMRFPSADRPTGEWVPIEDGLPDINIKHKGMCGDPDWYSSSLVVIKTDEPYLDPLGYEVGQFEMSADGEMYDFYDGNYYIKLKNIIAWMPIKPYKGGEDE